MKLGNYIYKHSYYLSSEVSQEIYDLREIISPNRPEIQPDHVYYTSSITISQKNPEIMSMGLGISLSPPDSYIRSRCREKMFLNFIVKGKGTLNGKPFYEGQAYYTLPYETHTVISDPVDPYVSAWLSIEGTYVQTVLDEINKRGSQSILPIENGSDIFELTMTLLYKTNLGETSTSYLKSLIDIYLFYIKPSEKVISTTEVFATEKIAQIVREAKAYVAKNLKYVTVADLAKYLHYNKRYFSGIFTEAIGMNPSEYINDCKMEWAKNSLTNSDLSITEIMEAIGYNHRNGFTIAFKKKYGFPPAEYRNKIKNQSEKSPSLASDMHTDETAQ